MGCPCNWGRASPRWSCISDTGYKARPPRKKTRDGFLLDAAQQWRGLGIQSHQQQHSLQGALASPHPVERRRLGSGHGLHLLSGEGSPQTLHAVQFSSRHHRGQDRRSAHLPKQEGGYQDLWGVYRRQDRRRDGSQYGHRRQSHQGRVVVHAALGLCHAESHRSESHPDHQGRQ